MKMLSRRRFRSLSVAGTIVSLVVSFADKATAQAVVPAAAEPTAPAAQPRVPRRTLLQLRLAQMSASADLNLDGLQDIAAIDFVADTVRVLLREPGAGFRAHDISTGLGPRTLAAADITQDGIVDLAVGEFLSGTIRILVGSGDGTFARSIAVFGQPGVSSLIAADFDQDGLVDLVTVNALSGSVHLLANQGRGESFEARLIGRAPGATFLSPLRALPTRPPDVIALDLDGRNAYRFTPVLRGGFVESRMPPADIADAIAGQGSVEPTENPQRLVKMYGDGAASAAGSGTEPLILAVRDAAGLPSSFEEVVFSRVIGDTQAIDDRGPHLLVSETRTVDEGRIVLPLLASSRPGISVIAAAVPDESTLFSVLSITSTRQLADAIIAASGAAPPGERSNYEQLLEQVVLFLDGGDVVGAVRSLTGSLQVEVPGESGQGVAGTAHAAELSRRLLNQLLLVGTSDPSPSADEAITCDVALVRTIASPSEVDCFRFTGVAGEKIHITFANEGGLSGFNPVWRLLGPDGNPVPGCDSASAPSECILPVDGEYCIEVSDAGANATGSYSVHYHRLTTSQRCGVAIVCDVAAVTTINARADADLHQFTTSAVNEKLHITFANEGGLSGFNPVWRLFGPDSELVPGCDTFTATNRICVLPAVGAYAIEVLDDLFNATGTYSLHLQRLSTAQRCGVAIVCDVAAVTTINARADADLHQFATSAVNEKLHITFANEGGLSGFNPVWRLFGPDAELVTGCDTFSATNRVCILPAVGAYAIEVLDDLFNATGTYSLHFQRLTTALRCGVEIVCDVASVTTINARADADLHQFTTTAINEKIHVTFANEGGLSGFNPMWRLFGPDAELVTGCDTFTAASRICILPAMGAYAIEVLDDLFNATGTYSVHFQRLSTAQRCGVEIVCDVATATTINRRADADLHHFTTAATNEKTHITFANEGGLSGFDPVWRLFGPDAELVNGCDTFTAANRVCLLPTAGAYAIEVVDQSHDSTGTYSVQFQRLTASKRCGLAIVCDVASVTTINRRADADLHQFTSSAANEKIHITLANEGGLSGFNPVWRLYGPDAELVAGCDTFATVNRQCVLPTVGPYAIEVLDDSFNATGTYSIQFQKLTAAQRCGVTITCNVPSSTTINARADTDLHQFTGAGNGVVQIAVTNQGGLAGFQPQWRLIGPDAEVVAGCDFDTASPRNCTLPATGAYAVEVQDGGFNATGSYGITVSGGGCTTPQADLVISTLTAPAKSGVGRSITIRATTANVGTSGAAATETGLYLSPDTVFGDGDDIALTAPIPVPALAAGASNLAKRTVSIPSVAAGTYYIIAVADVGNAQAEPIETNNTRVKAIAIGPDLVVSVISAPASAAPGASISVTVTTKNNGGGTTGQGSTTRLYFSNNGAIDASDTTFTDIAVGVLAPGAASATTVMLTVPPSTPLGTRYLIGLADAGQNVAETKETNNVRKKTITIQ